RHTRSYGDWSSDVCSSDLHFSPGAVLAGMAAGIRAAYAERSRVDRLVHAATKARAEGATEPAKVDMRPGHVGAASALDSASGVRSEERRVGEGGRSQGERE